MDEKMVSVQGVNDAIEALNSAIQNCVENGLIVNIFPHSYHTIEHGKITVYTAEVYQKL